MLNIVEVPQIITAVMWIAYTAKVFPICETWCVALDYLWFWLQCWILFPIFTKTICEARNLDNMKKRALPVIEEIGLKEGVDWGYINDSCLTELKPENPNGTCTIGMWFKPLPDEDAHKISKKFQLYRDESRPTAVS